VKNMYSEVVARALGWDPQDVIDIRIAAPMHDIGKVGIPDRILLKPDRLTDAEFALMQQHVVLGAEMLEGSEKLPFRTMNAGMEPVIPMGLEAQIYP